MALIKYPYTNLHELNLDWIIEQLNNKDGPVRSVNGKTGMVTLTGEDIARSSSNPETVSAALQSQGTSLQTVRNQIGVTPLPTTAQTLTGAIAENAQTIANVEDNVIGSTALPTTAQTLTGAIAENAQTIANIEDNVIGSTALPTTAQTLTGAVNELYNNIAKTYITSDDVLSVTTSSGTVQGSTIRLFFDEKFANLNGRIRIKDCIGRPTITITGIPTACPAINGYGNPTQVRMNGTNTGSIISDPCYVSHSINTTTATISFDNYLGDFPTDTGGYVVCTFNITCC